jgi:hypothetical protein
MLLNASRDDVRLHVLSEMNALQKQRFPQTVEKREAQARSRARRAQQPQAPALVPQFNRVQDLGAARLARYNAHAAVFGERCVQLSRVFCDRCFFF